LGSAWAAARCSIAVVHVIGTAVPGIRQKTKAVGSMWGRSSATIAACGSARERAEIILGPPDGEREEALRERLGEKGVADQPLGFRELLAHRGG
jgi:hypothetical protein